MGNSKYFLVSLAALILITVSIVFISIWGYKTFIAPEQGSVEKGTTSATSKNALESRPFTDSLPSVTNEPEFTDTNDLAQKLVQLQKLQAEIQTLINNRKTSDSNSTDERILKLENDIKSLESRNQSVVKRNRQLERAVSRLAGRNQKQSVPDKNKTTTALTPEISLKVSDIGFFALTDNQVETAEAGLTHILRASLFVRSSGASSGELIIVIMDPDGKVLLNSPWESGYFNTPDGRKIYTSKVHFEKPEQRVTFSIRTTDLKKGNYDLQVYYGGNLIATLKKSLS